ncbi:MAG TPA: hypothetical protein DCO83_17600 [Mucilaginibacter sp.]|nr:hypothetical protein [Mucilaginibacter sp.]
MFSKRWFNICFIPDYKKRAAIHGNPSEYVKKTKMELPYDYPLSHHQLLFIVFIVIYGTNMEIFFLKASRMIFLRD